MPNTPDSGPDADARVDSLGLSVSYAWTALIVLALLALLALAALPLTLGNQLLLTATLVMAMLILRPAALRQLYVSNRGLLLRFMLLTLGLFISTRYLLWRLFYTLPSDTPLDFALGLLAVSGRDLCFCDPDTGRLCLATSDDPRGHPATGGSGALANCRCAHPELQRKPSATGDDAAGRPQHRLPARETRYLSARRWRDAGEAQPTRSRAAPRGRGTPPSN